MICEKSITIRILFFVKACGEQLNTVVESVETNLDPIDVENYALRSCLSKNNIPNNGLTNKKINWQGKYS